MAGEHIVQGGENKSMVSNHFKINYIDDIDIKDEKMIFPNQRFNANLGLPRKLKKDKDGKPYLQASQKER